VGSLRFSDCFLPVQVCGYFIYTQAIGSQKRATSLTPKKGYQFGLHFGSFAVIKMRITFPKNTPSNRSSPVVRQNIFMGFYAFVVFFFFGFWLAAIYKFTCCMPLALFWLPVSDRTF